MDDRFVPTELRKMADLYALRNEEYGDSYKIFGHLMNAMFPDGLTIKGIRDWNRMGALMQIVGKITRYRAAFQASQRQDDSLRDLAVYATMLLELDLDLWTKEDEDPTLEMSFDEAIAAGHK